MFLNVRSKNQNNVPDIAHANSNDPEVFWGLASLATVEPILKLVNWLKINNVAFDGNALTNKIQFATNKNYGKEISYIKAKSI